MSISSRWPFGEFGDHCSKFGFRFRTIDCFGTYEVIMYGPVATRQAATVEMSLSGVPFGTANANGIAT